jgi:hypothetical protein
MLGRGSGPAFGLFEGHGALAYRQRPNQVETLHGEEETLT